MSSAAGFSSGDWPPVELVGRAFPEVGRGLQALFEEAFADGALSSVEKHLLAAAVHATFGRHQPVETHLLRAVRGGATPQQVLEAALPLLLSHGAAAWQHMVEAAARVVPGLEQAVPVPSAPLPAELACGEAGVLAYFRAHSGAVPEWAEALNRFRPGFLAAYARMRAVALADGQLPRRVKELVIVACHAAHRFERGAALHAAGARAAGASDAQVAEALLVAVSAAGIPGWLACYSAVEKGAR